MKLNGWLRLWIVLSVCWLLSVAYFAYADFSSIFEQKKWEVAKEGSGNTTLVFSGSQTDDEIKALISEEIVPLVEKEPQKYLGKVVTDPYDSHVQKRLSVTPSSDTRTSRSCQSSVYCLSDGRSSGSDGGLQDRLIPQPQFDPNRSGGLYLPWAKGARVIFLQSRRWQDGNIDFAMTIGDRPRLSEPRQKS